MEQLTLVDPLTPHQMAGRLVNKKAIQDFVFAGNATFTIRNTKTGTRFTYKIRKSKTNKVKFYVNSMRGPGIFAKMGVIIGIDKDYYLPYDWKEKLQMARKNFAALYPGHPFPEKEYTNKNMSESLKMFIKFLGWYKGNVEKIENHEIWHEGICGKCGRKLTVPYSIEVGIGPECLKQLNRG